MPSGKVHDRLTLATALVSMPLWVVLTPKHDPLVFCSGLAAYLFSGYWLSGDLDTNSICYKRWGLFKFIWWPYRLLIPHRSFWSHGPIVGPLIRIVYFAVAAFMVGKCAVLVINKYFLIVDKTGILVHTKLSIVTWLQTHPQTALAAILGLILGGLTHTVADTLVSFWKKIW